ncbi:MAG: PhoH family protein [Bifidobacteriaceae bacterium]|jgi:phosphate starvation-inducible PhoH-like protein|nr:PhoH family protein [Bifidobacteriaceae bacterium]
MLKNNLINNKIQYVAQAKSQGQRKYLTVIEDNIVTIAVGPAGTGKTFLAMSRAVDALLSKRVERIILTRPAVEAGERLGFLPGDLASKIDPYLRPLYDALNMIIEPASVNRLIEDNVIEVAPLAYMRGRTLNNSFIILDEAQNTSNEQMKMFLTRLGTNSKMVVTGDLTQIDLLKPASSGLITACKILKNIDGLGVVNLTSKDVVRHKIVSKIINAYDKR